MWPEIGPIPIYGVLYALGIVVHFYVSRHVAHRLNLERRVGIAVSLCYLVGMIPAAKLLYEIRQYRFDLTVVFSLKHYIEVGGLWGGLLAYLLLAIPATLFLTRNRRAALDLIAVSVPIPWALAKVGCLLNGCCHGRPCSLPWAITFPEGAGTAHGLCAARTGSRLLDYDRGQLRLSGPCRLECGECPDEGNTMGGEI